MHYLAVIGNTNIAEYILNHTNIFYKEDLYGQTPVRLAQWKDIFGIVDMLTVGNVYM